MWNAFTHYRSGRKVMRVSVFEATGLVLGIAVRMAEHI
jgi:hypothetical protein